MHHHRGINSQQPATVSRYCQCWRGAIQGLKIVAMLYQKISYIAWKVLLLEILNSRLMMIFCEGRKGRF